MYDLCTQEMEWSDGECPPREPMGEKTSGVDQGATLHAGPLSCCWLFVSSSQDELEKEVLDLKITNRGKDYFIEQLQKERDSFGKDRQEYVEKLMTFNRKVGELEIKLLQLEEPKSQVQENLNVATEQRLN